MLWHKLLFLGFVALGLAQLLSAAGETIECPANFTLISDKCVLVDSAWKTWFEADRKCRTFNATLLSIKNANEKKLLVSFLDKWYPYESLLWTSGNCLGKKGDYYWQSTGESVRYFDWAKGEPNQKTGDCMSLVGIYSSGKRTDFQMKLTNCTDWAGYICETKPLVYKQTICLQQTSFYEAKVPV